MSENTFDYIIVGAGSAGCGIAEQIIAQMKSEGLSEDEARARVFMVDRFGLLTDKLPNLLDFQSKLVQKSDNLAGWETASDAISLLDVVRKYGIEIVGDVNVPFNPEVHQAMSMMESADHQPNHVMMVMQKGYTLNGRLLRPAMVAVSKAKA